MSSNCTDIVPVMVDSYPVLIGSADKIGPYNLWLGDNNSAMDMNFLKKNSIDIIIDVGSNNYSKFVEGEHPFNKNNPKMQYYHIYILDLPTKEISSLFELTNDVIHKGLREGKNILVHCQAGVSRSASIVIAFIMNERSMGSSEATVYVRNYRPVLDLIRDLLHNLLGTRNKLDHFLTYLIDK